MQHVQMQIHLDTFLKQILNVRSQTSRHFKKIETVVVTWVHMPSFELHNGKPGARKINHTRCS